MTSSEIVFSYLKKIDSLHFMTILNSIVNPSFTPSKYNFSKV